jgi:hypothetical protein
MSPVPQETITLVFCESKIAVIRLAQFHTASDSKFSDELAGWLCAIFCHFGPYGAHLGIMQLLVAGIE